MASAVAYDTTIITIISKIYFVIVLSRSPCSRVHGILKVYLIIISKVQNVM